MFKSKVEDRYTVVAVSQNQLQDIAAKYKGQKDVFYIPSNNPTLKTSNLKLFPKYTGGLLGFVAFKDVKDEVLTSAKFVHVVKSKATKILDITKGLTKELTEGRWADIFSALMSYEPIAKDEVTRLRAGFGYQLVVGIEPNKPTMCVFIDERSSPKVPAELLETVTTQAQSSVELTAEEQELLKQYNPDLGDHTSFRVPMSEAQFKQEEPKMSDDDIAWHLISSNNGLDIGELKCVRRRLGFKEICLLNLMNKNISKKARSSIASYMLDKAGVSFVGGPTLKKYIGILAKQGFLEKNLQKEADADALIDAIFYGKISDPEELRKIDYKEYGYQLANNSNTPPDVLAKIVAYEKKKKGKDEKSDAFRTPEVEWSGYNPNLGGKAGKDFTFSFSKTLQNPNYPIGELLRFYSAYMKKYPAQRATENMAMTLWNRPDCPKSVADVLVKEFGPADHPIPPACYNEQEFEEYWKKVKTKNAFALRNILDHPHVPTDVLKELLKIEDEHGALKPEIYKELENRGALTEDETVGKVKKDLKFEGPKDLLKHFGIQAWLGTKGKSKLKFTPVTEEELGGLKKEMAATTVHDDFSFEVVAAYRVDKQIHKDYHKQAKDINHVKHGLYHGTSMANAAGIIATGINVAAKSRTGQMFGNGFYLASSASKAAQYASDNFSKSGLGIVFKMDVALGNVKEMKYGRSENDKDPENEDEYSAIEKRAKELGLSPREIPLWHLTHDSVHAKKGLSLNHDEFVIKDGQQININEIIVVHKTEKN